VNLRKFRILLAACDAFVGRASETAQPPPARKDWEKPGRQYSARPDRPLRTPRWVRVDPRQAAAEIPHAHGERGRAGGERV